jgi:hypothetical protein
LPELLRVDLRHPLRALLLLRAHGEAGGAASAAAGVGLTP